MSTASNVAVKTIRLRLGRTTLATLSIGAHYDRVARLGLRDR